MKKFIQNPRLLFPFFMALIMAFIMSGVLIFINLGFLELAHFTSAGIMYIENYDFIITGPIGSNRLQVKCRRANCESKLDDLEKIFQNI
jgi:hypothetical protein